MLVLLEVIGAPGASYRSSTARGLKETVVSTNCSNKTNMAEPSTVVIEGAGTSVLMDGCAAV